MAILTVQAGENLQTALTNAVGGDTIVLEAGATFTGNFTCGDKASLVTVTSSATLPARRITPEDAALLPTIKTPNTTEALSFANGVGNWKFDGIRLAATVPQVCAALVFAAPRCDHLTFDRCLYVGDDAIGVRRPLYLNGTDILVDRCHLANIWDRNLGSDSQAILVAEGAGPYTIRDCFLEAASENIMIGGSDVSAVEHIPDTILVENCTLTKPLAWKGLQRGVKNIFELKCATNVILRNCTLENCWTDAQTGWAVMLTPRNQFGGAPWTVIEDVLIEKCIIRNTERGINIAGYDDLQESEQTKRITIQNNLVVTTFDAMIAGGEIDTLTIEHNTFHNGSNFLKLMTGVESAVWPADENLGENRDATYAVATLTVRNNLGYYGAFGVIAPQVGLGTAALNGAVLNGAAGYTWTHNVLAGADGTAYPTLTLKPTVAAHEANFNADYTLVAGSTYIAGGHDGTDLGRLWGLAGSEPLITTVHGGATLTSWSGGRVATATLPTGTVAGDYVEFWINCNDASGTLTLSDANPLTPTTAALEAGPLRNPTTGHTLFLYARHIAAGDPTTFTWDLSHDNRGTAQAHRWRNPHTESVYAVAPGSAGTTVVQGTTGNLTVPSITTPTDKAIHVSVLGTDQISNTTASTPAGYTVPANGNGGQKLLAVAYKVITPAGATGTTVWADTMAATKTGVSYALRAFESPVGPPPPPPPAVAAIPRSEHVEGTIQIPRELAQTLAQVIREQLGEVIR